MVDYHTNARKGPINERVNEDLVEKARALHEERLAEETVLLEREAFQRDAELITEALNEVHAQHGSPIDEYLAR